MGLTRKQEAAAAFTECSVPSCPMPARVRGLCKRCYGSVHYHVKRKGAKDLKAWKEWMMLRLDRAEHQIDFTKTFRRYWGGPWTKTKK